MVHDELAHSLAQHLKSECRMVWENIPAGMAGSVRPDVYTMEKSFANPNPITYEVKVSVSDFRNDITSAKWKSYLSFSYGVVFAVPRGLISKNDLPNGCGLITYNGDGIWRTAKKPTMHPCRLDGDVMLKLLIGGSDRMTQTKPIKNRDFDQWQHMETLRDKFGKNISEKISLIERYPDMKKELNSLKKELGELLGVDVDRWNFCNSAKYKIEQIRMLADEKERKSLIVKELNVLKSNIENNINRTINSMSSA